jgi:hypothetical protein
MTAKRRFSFLLGAAALLLATAPTKLPAVFIVDSNDMPLTTPEK